MTTLRFFYFICFAVFTISNSQAETFEDPTKPADYLAPELTDSTLENLTLNGIWTTAKTRWALLNQIKFISIHKESVLIEENNNRRLLYLLKTKFKTH